MTDAVVTQLRAEVLRSFDPGSTVVTQLRAEVLRSFDPGAVTVTQLRAEVLRSVIDTSPAMPRRRRVIVGAAGT